MGHSQVNYNPSHDANLFVDLDTHNEPPPDYYATEAARKHKGPEGPTYYPAAYLENKSKSDRGKILNSSMSVTSDSKPHPEKTSRAPASTVSSSDPQDLERQTKKKPKRTFSFRRALAYVVGGGACLAAAPLVLGFLSAFIPKSLMLLAVLGGAYYGYRRLSSGNGD
jgi:hypothetical protein